MDADQRAVLPGLPHDASYFVTWLARLQTAIRDRVRVAVTRAETSSLHRSVYQRGGDTIFELDVRAEQVLDELFSLWGQELPLLLIAEGLEGGERVYPAGTDRGETAFTCIVDPVDGTRGLMYGKRSAWVLSAIAPPPSAGTPTLDRIVLAMQTELPTSRSFLSDVLWATPGGGVRAETHDLVTGAVRTFVPRTSQADTLHHGFATVVKFFPRTTVLAAEVEERLVAKLGAESGVPLEVFDDEYISSGGQLYELITGRDRFIADLRPLLATELGGHIGLSAHPYDLCTELVAREAGVVVTDSTGQPLRYPLDVSTECSWVGYANERLFAYIAPVLRRVLADMKLPS